MKKKRATEPQVWEWRESRTVKRQDELCFGDQLFATLRWEGPFSNHAYARSPEGQWTFDRPRLLSRDVEVQANETLIAVYHEKWTGDGTLEFVDGRTYDWAPTNFWQTRWVFFETDKLRPAEAEPLIAFDDTSGLLEHRTEVSFRHSDLSKADVDLLVTLGRYLMELKRQDTAAITAATTTAVVT